jgi:streptogramin lyase
LEALESRLVPSQFNEFTPPSSAQLEHAATGADGNVWFTENGYTSPLRQIGRITPQGVITEFAVPHPPFFGFGGITNGPDGNVWFTESENLPSSAPQSYVARITPGGAATEYPLPQTNTYPRDITNGPLGDLWFLVDNHDGFNSTSVGRVTPQGAITEFTLPPTVGAYDIAAGPDGNLWVTSGSRIGRITPGGQVTTFDLPAGTTTSRAITGGPDGNLWALVSVYPQTAVARITPAGGITEFILPSQAGLFPLGGITPGPDGSVWFVHDNNVGRVTPQGAIAEFPVLPAGHDLLDITTGADGNLWVTEDQDQRIGQFIFRRRSGLTATGRSSAGGQAAAERILGAGAPAAGTLAPSFDVGIPGGPGSPLSMSLPTTDASGSGGTREVGGGTPAPPVAGDLVVITSWDDPLAVVLTAFA